MTNIFPFYRTIYTTYESTVLYAPGIKIENDEESNSLQ